jgi:hypothetical protein
MIPALIGLYNYQASQLAPPWADRDHRAMATAVSIGEIPSRRGARRGDEVDYQVSFNQVKRISIWPVRHSRHALTLQRGRSREMRMKLLCP